MMNSLNILYSITLLLVGCTTLPDSPTRGGRDGAVSPTCSCDGRECGDDGCGGTCGTCSGSLMCISGSCTPGAQVDSGVVNDASADTSPMDSGVVNDAAQDSSTTTDAMVDLCGDGMLNAGEACDDGNTTNGDGCSSMCAAEAGWDCSGPTCSAICGDGLMVGTELCDDNNTSCGLCNADCTQLTTATPATGRIVADIGNSGPGFGIRDGQTFTLGDGWTRQTFEFDNNGSMPTNAVVLSTGFVDSNVVAGAIRLAINNSTLRIVASGSGDNVDLTNALPGVRGNTSSTHTTTSALGWSISDMTGGQGRDCENGARCTSHDDCRGGLCNASGLGGICATL